jgi:ERCC4-type nuclease
VDKIIYCDPRSGSGDQIPFLRPILASYGIAMELCDPLDGGDFFFSGNGESGDCAIGFERKTIGDMISSMRSGRLTGHQIPNMLAMYEYSYIILEGIWRPNKDGYIEQLYGHEFRAINFNSQPYRYSELYRFLCSIKLKCGIIIERTGSIQETAHLLANEFLWWSKPWEEHSAHLAIHRPNLPNRRISNNGTAQKSSFPKRVALQIDDVGIKTYTKVTDRFPTVRKMVEATEKEWREVPGIGVTMSKRIVRAFNDEGGEG